jgi:hypothetical protein
MVKFGLFFFDADLDGWQDLFMVNGHVANEAHLRNVPYAQPPQLFRNQGNGTFVEVRPAPQSGLDRRIIGRGAAYADYDNDGDLDRYSLRTRARPLCCAMIRPAMATFCTL